MIHRHALCRIKSVCSWLFCQTASWMELCLEVSLAGLTHKHFPTYTPPYPRERAYTRAHVFPPLLGKCRYLPSVRYEWEKNLQATASVENTSTSALAPFRRTPTSGRLKARPPFRVPRRKACFAVIGTMDGILKTAGQLVHSYQTYTQHRSMVVVVVVVVVVVRPHCFVTAAMPGILLN